MLMTVCVHNPPPTWTPHPAGQSTHQGNTQSTTRARFCVHWSQNSPSPRLIRVTTAYQSEETQIANSAQNNNKRQLISPCTGGQSPSRYRDLRTAELVRLRSCTASQKSSCPSSFQYKRKPPNMRIMPYSREAGRLSCLYCTKKRGGCVKRIFQPPCNRTRKRRTGGLATRVTNRRPTTRARANSAETKTLPYSARKGGLFGMILLVSGNGDGIRG